MRFSTTRTIIILYGKAIPFLHGGALMILHGGDIHDDEWAGYYVWVSRDFSYENVIVILRDGAAHDFACRGDP